MKLSQSDSRSRHVPSWDETIVLGLTVVVVGVLVYLLPPVVRLLCLFVGLVGFVYVAFLLAVEAQGPGVTGADSIVPVVAVFTAPVAVGVGSFVAVTGPTVGQLVVLGALLVVFFYFWFVIPAAWFHTAGTRATETRLPTSSLSVLVPAYNEARYLGRCLEAILAADYPGEMEVIVVDDGSTDGTYYEANAYTSRGVTVLRQANGGKHSALNAGLERATGDAIVTVDADSFVQPDALARIVADLESDPTLGAAAGTVTLPRPTSVVETVQALEYAIGINTFRRAFAVLGAVNVVPGCLGCFRREALESVGGYSDDTITEDFDVTLSLLRAGWSVRASDARVETVPPSTWRALYRQRIRWSYGNIETVWKHAGAIRSGRIDGFTGIVFPYQVLSLVALPLATVVIVGTIVVELLAGNVLYVATLLALFTLLQFAATLFALVIDDADLGLLLYVPVVVTVYKVFIDAVLLTALVNLLRGARQSWNHERSTLSGSSTVAAREWPVTIAEPGEGGSSDD